MAILDLSHTEAIPLNIINSGRFKKVINLERRVGPDYCPPNFNTIGGELLDINWKSYRTKTTKYMMVEKYLFGLVFLVDLATIKGRPIISIIAF